MKYSASDHNDTSCRKEYAETGEEEAPQSAKRLRTIFGGYGKLVKLVPDPETL